MSVKRYPAQMLLDYQQTVNRIHDGDKGLYMLLFKTIRQWYGDNGVRLESLKDRIKSLQKEFVQHKMVKSTNRKGEEIEVEGDEMIIIPEKEITIPAKYEMKVIKKASWFSKEKTEQSLIEPEQKKVIPREVVFKEGKTQADFDIRYKALIDELVDITF